MKKVTTLMVRKFLFSFCFFERIRGEGEEKEYGKGGGEGDCTFILFTIEQGR